MADHGAAGNLPGDEQPAGGLRVAEQKLFLFAQVGRHLFCIFTFLYRFVEFAGKTSLSVPSES